jgi:filamentous hemagglutinin family protein
MNNNNKLTTIIMFVLMCATSWALPGVTSTNLQTSAGVTTNITGNTLTITAPNRAILSWQNFGNGADAINVGDTINYTLPASSASVLNVVGGATNTRIDGSITSNGNVFILNPNGIIVGNGSRIDVNSLTLSTSDNVAFASYYYQTNGKLPVQDKLSTPSGNITISGAVGTKEGLHLFSKDADVGNLVSQGNVLINANGTVFTGSGGTTYITGDLIVNNEKGTTNLSTNGNSLVVANNITVTSDIGSVSSAANGSLTAKKLTVNTKGDISLVKTNITDVAVTGGNVSVALDSGLNSVVTATGNGTVNVTSPGFLTANIVNQGTADTTVTAGGILTLGDVHNTSTGNTTFTGSAINDSKPGVFVYNNVTFNANGGNVTVTKPNHSFGPVSINSVSEAFVYESGALNLNRVTASKLTAKSNEFIFQTPTTGVINASNLDVVTPGNVTLDAAGNLYSNITVNGGNVSVASGGPITFGNVNANGTFTAKAGTFITQAADTKMSVTGNTTFNATTITAANDGNQFGPLTVDVGAGTAAITENSTLNLVSLKAGTAALKSLESVITSGTGSVTADTFNIIAGVDFVPTAVLKAVNPLTVLAGKGADLSLLSLAANLGGKTPTVIAMTYKAPQP